jgi:hypothetical protein
MTDMKAFVENLRQELTKALCIVNFPSRTVERVNRWVCDSVISSQIGFYLLCKCNLEGYSIGYAAVKQTCSALHTFWA